MVTITQNQKAPLIRAGNLEVKLATNMIELDAAMRLRFEVFNLELQEGLISSYDRGYDTDAYDAYCDHLIVKDLACDEVVGTYRLLRGSQAQRHIGFYSENEFDLSNLKQIGGEMLELGRSCIAATHRSFGTLNLLWSAIANYALERNLSHLFGCASLHISEAGEVQPVYSYLRANHFAPEKYRVYPVESCRMTISDEASEEMDSRAALRKLSPILKGYLRAGAMICGAPAYDAEFGTADVLVILEMEKMAGRYKQHYVAGSEAVIN
ncbi:MAG TPA: GNAT family N-acyltransferase [Blastocatellia bacterium]|nr:GNAT family N-acyltransferase [Blastocatellia bacterium]